MKAFISEYGLTILECIGASIIISILYTTFFKTGLFLSFISTFLQTLMGE